MLGEYLPGNESLNARELGCRVAPTAYGIAIELQ